MTAQIESSSDGRALERWHERLLPLMTRSLVAMGVIFFIATLWLFFDLTQRTHYEPIDLVAVVDRLPKTGDDAQVLAYREWYVRAILEKSAQEQRFALQSMVVQGRLWTRLMGFLTGMILCLSGCVFVLGRLRESVEASAEGGGLKASLTTASPGVFLAFAGAILIAIALWVPTSVESSDASVYLPRQIEVLHSGAADERPAPAAVEPAADRSQDATSPQAGPPPALPASVRERLDAEVGQPPPER